MAELYGTTLYPSDQIRVEAGETYAVSAAFSTSAGLVGVGDTAENDAEEGTLYNVSTSSQGRQLFGSDSELQEQIELAFLNGATEVHAVAVEETQSTETFTGTSQFTLSEAPVFDPDLHSDKDVTIQDTGEGVEADVNVVHETPVPQPTSENTVNFNPNTGEANADSSSDYEVIYEYGSYTSAIEQVVGELPRAIGVATENTTLANTLATEMSNRAGMFDFTRGFIGASPLVDAGEYEDNFDNRRLSVVSTSRGYLDDAETNEARTVGAVVGKQAGKPLGDSTTYEGVDGFASLRTPQGGYTDQDISDFISAQVMPLIEDGGVTIIKDMNTSTEPRFERIYGSEIIDEVIELVHQVAESFVGKKSIEDNLTGLEDSIKATLDELEADNLIVDSVVDADYGASQYEADVDVGIQIVGIFDTIDVSISVGDVITNTTAE